MMRYLKYILISIILIVLAAFLIRRYGFYFKYYDEIKFVRSFWALTIESESPTDEWRVYLRKEAMDRDDWLFYSFKVWFIDYSPNIPDRKLLKVFHASILYHSADGTSVKTNDLAVSFRYGNERQILNTVVVNEEGRLKLYPSLSLDHCDWSPDRDRNGIVDIRDVDTAKKKKP